MQETHRKTARVHLPPSCVFWNNIGIPLYPKASRPPTRCAGALPPSCMNASAAPSVRPLDRGGSAGTGYKHPFRRALGCGSWCFGKRFYRDELGIDSQVLWLPDTFGYSAVLPRSFWQAAAFRYLVPRKFSGAITKATRFPIITLVEGHGRRSQVINLSALPATPTGPIRRVCGVWKKRVQKAASGRFPDPLRLRRRRRRPCRDHVSMPCGARP